MFYFFKSVNTRKELNIFNFQLESLNFIVAKKKLTINLRLIKYFFYNLEICFEIRETFLETVVLFKEPFLEAFITCD